MYKSNWRREKERYQRETSLLLANLIIFLVGATLLANFLGLTIIL